LGTYLNYRADIDGLRAVAVLSVVIYHIGKSVGFNGYLGVDIFFVISGYLITGIIKKQVSDGTFTFRDFYVRRIRRIIPILIVVLAASTIVAIGLFLPSELELFAKSVVAALFFSSNIFFYGESGYFAADAELKPLLHTWSLSVEEQFYIFFPIVLILLLGRGLSLAKIVVSFLLVLSLAWNMLFPTVFKDSSFAFYMFPVRAWELLFGACISLRLFPRPPKNWIPRECLGGLSVALILAGFLPNYPGNYPYVFQTLPVVLGTALFIFIGEKSRQSFINRALSLKYAVFVGKISYSLYLWHWPVYVFALYYNFGRLTDPERFGLIVLSLMLSVLSWKYVEQPFRRSHSARLLKSGAYGACAVSLMLIITNVSIVRTNGFLPWMPSNIATLVAVELGGEFKNVTDDEGQTVAVLGNSQEAKDASVLLIGDSHADAIRPAIDLAAKANKRTVIALENTCFASFEDFKAYQRLRSCVSTTRHQLRYILDHPNLKTIVIAQRWQKRTTDWHTKSGMAADIIWERRLNSLMEFVQELKGAGHEVIILAQVPLIETKFQNVPSTIARMKMWKSEDLETFGPTAKRYLSYNRNVLQILQAVHEKTGTKIVYPHTFFCSQGPCQIYDAGGTFYYDDDHLSVYGARKLTDTFLPLL
jgi:peptidoglycan/LPS O-acetylase OafA/YrhL